MKKKIILSIVAFGFVAIFGALAFAMSEKLEVDKEIYIEHNLVQDEMYAHLKDISGFKLGMTFSGKAGTLKSYMRKQQRQYPDLSRREIFSKLDAWKILDLKNYDGSDITYTDFPKSMTKSSKIILSLGNAFAGSGSGIEYGELSKGIAYKERIDIGLSIIITNIKAEVCKKPIKVKNPNYRPYPEKMGIKNIVFFDVKGAGCYQNKEGELYYIRELLELDVVSKEQFYKEKGIKYE